MVKSIIFMVFFRKTWVILMFWRGRDPITISVISLSPINQPKGRSKIALTKICAVSLLIPFLFQFYPKDLSEKNFLV